VVGVIGAPSSLGAYAPGQELAPERLRDAKLVSRLEQFGVEVHDRGDLSSRRWSPDLSSRRAQNVDGVIAAIGEVRDAVAACL
jgi:arginase